MGFVRLILVGVFTGIYVRKLSNLIKLKSFKNKTTQEIDNQYINDSMIEYIISQNEEAKTEYDTLLLLLKTDFKKQITGTHLKGMTINQGQN